MVGHENIGFIEIQTLQAGDAGLKAREPEAHFREVYHIPMSAMFAAGKATGEVAADAPGDTQQRKQDNYG